MEKQVVINFSVQEYEFLSKKARETGEESVSLFIRSVLFPEEKRDQVMERLLELVESIPEGSVFTLKELLGLEWRKLDRGRRLALGKWFAGAVASGNIDVTALERSKSSGKSQEYVKKVRS